MCIRDSFIAEQCRQHPEFIGFMAMHQDYPEPEKEIERAIGLGLKGMKLHPDTQHVNMDDPRLMNVYVKGQTDRGMAEIALQYNSSYNELLLSFANNVNTPDGGTHEEG